MCTSVKKHQISFINIRVAVPDMVVYWSELKIIKWNVIFAEVADSYIKISASLIQLANIDPGPLDKFLTKVADVFEKARVISLVLM